jgi:LCP family protein required for cell wall assembly
MPNRYNGRDEDNIPNTDNEDTMLLPGGVNPYSAPPKQELPPLRRVNRRSTSSQQSSSGASQQPPHFPQSGQPPQFPRSEQPPQFPHSAPPQQQNYSEPQYYDYNQQSPQEYSGGGYYAPPMDEPAPPPPPKQPQKRKKTSAPQPEPEEHPKKKKRHHKSLLRRIVGRIFKTVLALFMILFCMYSCTSVALIKKMDYQPSESRTHYADTLGRGHVRSMLVIGTDGRTADDKGRSDSMILVSLNSKTNEIIMTSFMRDCYVELPNTGSWDKLNAAYAYGGADLLMDTIEYNFDVRIDDYVAVDFASFVSVVDAVGGIDIDVSNEEAEEINVILISEVNELMGDDRMSDLLSGGGKLHLNGKQALSYSRIRKVGNSDFERTERQRRVMSLIIAKLKKFKPSIFKNLASDVIPDVSTNMSTLKAYLYSLRLPFALKYKTKQIQIPVEGTYSAADVDVGNVLQVDFGENRKVIDEEVFAKD